MLGRYFSDKTERGIDFVWMQHDREKMLEGRQLLTEAAEEGDADALCFLARTYMGAQYVWQYSGLDEDDDRAEKLLRESIQRGSACGVLIAMRCGVLTLYERRSMPFASLKEAWDIVYKKAEAGHPFCQYIIGNAYFWWDIFEIEGTKPVQKYQTMENAELAMAQLAELWFERAAAGGLESAVNNWYALYDGTNGYPENKAQQLEIARRGAEAGFPVWMYNYGWDLDHDECYAEAHKYLQRAAGMGQASAWIILGNQYLNGNGVPEDRAAALRCYENGARSGLTDAQYMTALLYYQGKGVPKDSAKVFYWAQRAVVEGDDKEAYVLLGHVLLRGEGTQKDEKKGLDLLLTAQKHDAQEYEKKRRYLFSQEIRGILCGDLGDVYADGIVVNQDYEKAIAYYDVVADWDSYAQAQRARFKKSFFSRKWTRR